MLWLENAETPKGCLSAVLEFLDSEAARYRRSAEVATKPREKALAHARCVAVQIARDTLADCNVMRGSQP